MSTSAHTPLEAASYQSAAITPADFYRTFDPYSGNRFDRGTIRHIRAALAGQPVIVVQERSLSQVGARLDGAATSRSGTEGELITTAYRSERTGDLVEQSTITRRHDIAMLIPIGENALSAKHTAIRTYMDEASGAIGYAQRTLGITTGTWTAVPGDYSVQVTCRENIGPSSRAVAHLEVPIADAEAVVAERQARVDALRA